MTDSQNRWQDVAWDGLCLQLPAEWHPTVILKSYLLFEQDGKPVCEIKWQQTRGTFSPDKVLGRFQKTLGKDVSISAWTVPDTWHLRHPFTVSGFRLLQDTLSCHGVLLFCPFCRRTTLIRFYNNPDDTKETTRHIVQSLSDHTEKVEQPWSVFDIRALLPVDADLQSHEFLPGRFTLTFAYEGAMITLYRFRPAAAILKNQSLADFGASLGGRNKPVAWDDNVNVVRFIDHATGLDRLRTKLRRKPSWHWLQLCYFPEPNVILGVKGEGRKGENIALLEYVSNHYTVTEQL